MRALPPVARAVSSNPDAYVYLAESIRAWPDQPELAARLQGAGWTEVGLAQSDRRHRGAAPGDQAGRGLTAARGAGARTALPSRRTAHTVIGSRHPAGGSTPSASPGVITVSACRIPSRRVTAIDRSLRASTIATTCRTPAARTRSSVACAAAVA